MTQLTAPHASPLTVHPLWLRLTHAVNAVSVLVMIASGWRIYDATSFLGFSVPVQATLGGWLAGALQWHFAAMWVLVVNGLTYLVLAVASGRLHQRMWPVTPRALWNDVVQAAHGRLGHQNLSHYNQVQRLAYLFAIADVLLLVLSGLVLWKSVQFPLLRELLGGYEGARRVHFVTMSGLVLFIVVHVSMALLVPRSLLAMARGH